MKYILSLLFLLSFTVSFGQITINELINVYNMDSDEFELYAISKGYKFYAYVRKENINGIEYRRGNGSDQKIFRFHNEYFNYGKMIDYTTIYPDEVLNFKINIKKNGYSLTNSQFNEEGTKIEAYRDLNYQIVIFSSPPTPLVYSISLIKL